MTFRIPRRELLEALELLSRNPLTEQTRCVVVGCRPNQMRVDEGDALRAAFNYILDLEGVIGDMMELAPRGFAPRGMSVQAFIDDMIYARNQRYERKLADRQAPSLRAVERERHLAVAAAAMAAFDNSTPEQKERVVAALRTAGAPIAPQPEPNLPAPFTVDAPRAAVPQLQDHTSKGTSA